MQQQKHAMALAMAIAVAAVTTGFAQTATPPAASTTVPTPSVMPRAAAPAVAQPGTTVVPTATTTPPMTQSGVQQSSPPSAARVGGSTATGTPVAGANSFTESQARSRIEAAGFSQITNLRKDDQGIWRGQAMHAGASTPVSMDFHGAVTAR
jgi:hypothetical protein